MSQDTLNKFVTVFQAVSFSFILWDNIKSLAAEIDRVARLNDEDELEAFMDALDELDPNTPRWLAWQSIKAWANEPDD